MESQNLGQLIFDKQEEVYKSSPRMVSAIKNRNCTFVFDDLDHEMDALPEHFEAAVSNFMGLPTDWSGCLLDYLWEYYQETAKTIGVENVPEISKGQIVNGIEFGTDISVLWDCDERDVYISLESECDWEVEHGLQITLKNGLELAKVGPCDGHVTNADAYDRDDFEGVIYVKEDMI